MFNLQNRICDRSLFTKNACEVARWLLGKYVVRTIDDKFVVCRITEVEAYVDALDDACHGYNNRRTQRNEALFWEGGYSYVFLIYGMYHCFNIVTDHCNIPSAVLIRAGEVIIDERQTNSEFDYRLANGPGKFCRYLAINRGLDQIDLLTSDKLFLVNAPMVDPSEIVTTARINIDYAVNYKDKPFRFYLRNSRAISRK